MDTPEPLLSSDETDALLGAMRAGGEGAASVEQADIGSPERRLRVALGHADRAGQLLAEGTRRLILRIANCTSAVEDQPAEITPYSVLRSAFRNGSALVSLRATDGSFALMTVSFVLDRRLGAPLATDEADAVPAERTQLSPVDRRVLRPFVEDLAGTFARAWCDDARALRVEAVLTQPNELPELGQFEPLLRVAVKATPTGSQGDEIMVAMTSGAVSASLPGADEQASLVASADDQSRMAARVAAAEVEAVAVLGRSRSTIRDVLALTVGDVIRLDGIPSEPTTIYVEGRPLMRGHPVIHHGNLALEITEQG